MPDCPKEGNIHGEMGQKRNTINARNAMGTRAEHTTATKQVFDYQNVSQIVICSQHTVEDDFFVKSISVFHIKGTTIVDEYMPSKCHHNGMRITEA